MSVVAVGVEARAGALGKWAALPVLLSGTAMIVLDFFIVNVALPAMQARLGATASAIEWVVACYGLAFASCLITAGRLGDQIGRRRIFALGLALFTLASAACGLASDPDWLVAARVVQGLAGGLISPNVLGTIGVVYRGPDRVRAITVYGLVLGLAAVFAQLIGGLLVEADVWGLGWRTVFLINLPIGLVALVLTPRFVPESKSEQGGGLDLVGTGLLTAALLSLLVPLVDGRAHGWPAWAIEGLVAAPVLLAGFVLHQWWLSRRGGAPLLDPAMFRERAFAAGLVTQVVFWGGQASFFLVLALYLQQGRGLGPLAAGGVFTVMAAAYLAASLRAPALTVRHGRRVVALGALTMAVGHGLLLAAVEQVGVAGPVWVLAPGLALVGGGMGLCVAPLVSIVLANVEPRRAGAASGVLSTVQQVGNSIGVAVTGLLFFGALGQGYGPAFALSLVQIVVLFVAVAALTRLLPAQANGARP